MTRTRTKPKCAREGCTRRKPYEYRYCTNLCRVLDEELFRTQHLCETLGPNDLTNTLWAALVTCSDAWTEAQNAVTRISEQAQQAGMSREQWRALRNPPRIDQQPTVT